jgi:oligopeptide/dipeptide ABC transporter ATP-binding protein
MGIHTATAGRILFQDQDIAPLKPYQSRKFRQHLQYCYQDPGASLDPRWTIRASLHEPLIVHTELPEAEREVRVREILAAVGLPDAHLDLYPHEISGGQQRRVGLARILTLKPSVVILDEPTSGLDVSVQATILKLFLLLQQQFRLTYLFVSHDLSVVRMICDRLAVMYLGRIVEIGDTDAIFRNPRHPYTQSLLAAIPRIGGPRVTDTFALEGEPPSPTNLPSGCRFRTRCPRAEALCAEQDPVLRTNWPKQAAACHFAE